MPILPDDELVQALLRDETGAYGTYAQAYGDTLFKFIAARTHNLADAEEIHNDVLRKVLQTWRAGQGSLKGWLYRLAKQGIVAWARSRAGEEPVESLEHLIESGREPLASESGPVSGDRLATYRTRLREYIQNLPPGEQQLFQLCFVQNMTDQQVAALTGKKAASVKTMRCRLVKKIMDGIHN